MSALQSIAPEQHQRSKFIGGSDIAAILGISPWRTAVDLWLDKIKPPRPENDVANAQAKARGSRLEPYILDMIREEHGIQVVRRGQRYRDQEVPYFAAEIDAETEDGVNVEIKTVHPFKAREWGEQHTDELPIHYNAQVQWGLGVTGRKGALVFALIGDDLRQYRLTADAEIIEAMRARASEFWQRYVVPKERPPLNFSDSGTLETLRKLYPGTDGSTIEARAEHEHWRAVLATAEDQLAHYRGVVEGAKAHLLSEMGNAALLRFADGKAFRRKEISQKACVIEKPACRYIDFRLVNVKE